MTGPVQAVRPKMVLFKNFEEAAVAVDEMFNVVFQNAGGESGSRIEADPIRQLKRLFSCYRRPWRC